MLRDISIIAWQLAEMQGVVLLILLKALKELLTLSKFMPSIRGCAAIRIKSHTPFV